MNAVAADRSPSGRPAGQRPDAPVFRFSNADCAQQDRLAAWRDRLRRGVQLRLDVEPLGEEPPRARVELHRWPAASLYFGETTPVLATRTPELVQDGDHDFRLLRVEGAACRYVSRGVEAVIPDGGAALLFNGAVGSTCYLGPCRVTGIRLRRKDLAAAVRGFDDRPIRPIAPGPALHLLSGYADTLRRTEPAADPILANRIASHLTDLTALALGATQDGAEGAKLRGARAARFSAIKADIEQRLGSDDLSVGAVAARHRLPVRYLQRLFEAEGTTFSEFVLERRLAFAHRLLTDPRFAHQPIGTVALEAGFLNQSYFNRTFRGRFNAAPSEVRAEAARAGT